MRVLVTGASGWIGSAVVPELLTAGHDVLALARSDASAAALAAIGDRVEVLRGTLDDVDVLREAAAASDGVVHLGFKHDFSDFAASVRTDRLALEAFGTALAGTGRPLVFASGVLGAPVTGLLTEDQELDGSVNPRLATGNAALSLAEHGVRPSAVRLAPTVHGAGDHGFVATLVGVARRQGVSAYVGDGAHTWPAVHRLDAAQLFLRALEDAPAGAVLHAVAEEGVATRDIAEAIGSALGVPTVSVPAERAAEHFGWIGPFFGLGAQVSSELTRERFAWTPSGPTLLEDLAAGRYTAGVTA